MSGSASATAPAAVTSDGGVALGVSAPCYTALPAAWSRALTSHALWHDQWDHLSTGAPTPEASGVLHEQDTATAAQLSILGANRRVVQSIGRVSRNGQGQYSSDAIDANHVAFVFNLTQGNQASNQWVLYLFDRHAGTLRAVARSPVDSKGNPLPGGWVRPVLTADYLYWIQAAPNTSGWGGSALMQYDLGSGQTRTLYRGLTESFVPYGASVLFTALLPHAPGPSASNNSGTGPPENVQAVDQRTGRSVPAPSGLTAGPDGANTMLADGDLVVWNTWDGAIHGWRPSWGKTITLVPSFSSWPEAAKLGLSSPAMPRLYGQFLVWNPSTDYVLDLRTNSFARLTAETSSEDLSGSALSLEVYADAKAYDAANQRIRFDQYLLDLSTLPDLAGCPAR